MQNSTLDFEAPMPRILIVDDEAPHVKALCDILKHYRYDTVGSTSPQAALELLGKNEFDLLLADLMMPEMNGIALLQAALKRDSNLVGVIMTGEGTVASAVEAMKAGALDYILKPFNLSLILPVLSRALAVRQLRLRNADLERRAREHTAELEALNKELETFSYSVSHDLRAPLRAIDGFTRMLLDDYVEKLDSEGMDYLHRVRSASQRMGGIIDGLLSLSRVTRNEMRREQLDLTALVASVVSDLRRAEPERTMQVVIEPGLSVYADANLMRIALENLLGNAWKFTRKTREPKIEVSSIVQTGQPVYFVRDNGAGFDMAYADKLFGAFQRFHPATEFEGTGIGLATVQRIIQRHGGRVWAESAIERGATFYFAVDLQGKEAMKDNVHELERGE